MNHLVLHLGDGRKVFISTNEVTDSMLCNRGRELMSAEWDKLKSRLPKHSSQRKGGKDASKNY